MEDIDDVLALFLHVMRKLFVAVVFWYGFFEIAHDSGLMNLIAGLFGVHIV